MQTSAPASLTAPPATARDTEAIRPPRARWTSLLVPVVVGLVLGPVDLLLQRVLPYPFANLANSPAVWALAAFAVGWSGRTRGRWWPAAAGTVAMVLAVESYYLAAVLALGDDVSAMTNSAALLWLALAVGAGVVFGTAGSWAHSDHRWRGPVGTAAAVGVLLAEAAFKLTLSWSPSADEVYRRDLVGTAVILVLLAAVTGVLAGRSAQQRLIGSLVALGLALLGALAFGLLFG